MVKAGKINWDADKNHVIKGSKSTPHDWTPFGIDPNGGDGVWPALLALLKKVVDEPDRFAGPYVQKNGSQIWFYMKDFDNGVGIIVKIAELTNGTLKLSDAWPFFDKVANYVIPMS